LESNENNEEYSFENSFLFFDTLSKIKLKENQPNQSNCNFSLSTIEETTRYIKEDDLFFEEKLRKKLLEREKKLFSLTSLTHLDILKIPFPNNPEDLNFKKYFENFIKEIKRETKGNFLLGNIHIEIKKTEEITLFVNDNDRDYFINDKLEKLDIYEDYGYLGINIKKFDEENYYILYLYAKKMHL